VVLRLAGPAGAGKTTLLIRTLAQLGRLDVAVVQANATEPGAHAELAGVEVVDEPAAHWRHGLRRTVERLSDSQLILVEDRDGPIDLGRGIGEDIQVGVIPAAQLAEITPERLDDAQALVVTRVDETPDLDLDAALGALRERCPGLTTFAVAAGHDDRGLDAWGRWLEAQVLHHRG
jgi:Ni2+-binding GTPase involved in maturation of urease and hydrogenase